MSYLQELGSVLAQKALIMCLYFMNLHLSFALCRYWFLHIKGSNAF